ncbi:hypothetical protein [Oceanibaculum sp.]|uniref:hypothetical protein n=1 Tax=Oceanibaculum sp. TaxID=1903597 RepID=UPI00258A4C5C|nr:hypothetical protein [Oceanibaculum sp.]MCH2395091.1 hypothetical protein [Oceanibaculum sp.]
MPSDAYLIVKNESEKFLKENKAIDKSSSKKYFEILYHIQKLISENKIKINISNSTIAQYISHAANNDPDSYVTSNKRRGGYWYQKPEATHDKIDEEEKIKTTRGQFTFKEIDLYELIEIWLQTKGYISKDKSKMKSGGKWGNPDIIGIERIEVFGSVQIELVSCEVKIRENNWKQDIFQAISHKRFCNRSWFCYRIKEEDEPIPEEIESYSEKYRVGVCQIFIKDNNVEKLKKNPEKYLERVIEKIPAPYDHVRLKEQYNFIERIGVTTTISFE